LESFANCQKLTKLAEKLEYIQLIPIYLPLKYKMAILRTFLFLVMTTIFERRGSFEKGAPRTIQAVLVKWFLKRRFSNKFLSI
jgi:hypothetical protein